jgi:protein-S-isoprenylcysteine O-methyltransferase Ste14
MDRTRTIVSSQPITRHYADKVLPFAGLAYGFIAYVLAIAFWPLFICFVGNLPRISDPLLERTVSVAPVILPTWQALAIDVGLITAFAVHHSLLARPSIKQIWWRWVSAPFRRATFTHLANLFAYAIVFHWQPIPIVLWQFDADSPLRYLIMVPFGIGWIMLLIGARSFNLAALFGFRQVWFWFKGKPYEPIDITASRIYNLARHPEFLGVFVGVWITPDMTVGHLLLASSFTAYSLIALRIKEGELGKSPGSSYASHCAKVPMLGPHWLTGTFVGIWLLVSCTAIVHTSAQRRHDDQARADIHRLQQVLIAYRARHGSYPTISDKAACELPRLKHAYDDMMAQLISDGLLAKPLAHPSRRPNGYGYCYAVFEDTGKAAVWTAIPSSPLSNTGEPEGCRPLLLQHSVYCSFTRANHDFCLCLP